MTIKTVTTAITGLVGVTPALCFIDTDSTLAQVLTTGALNAFALNGNTFSTGMVAFVTTSDTGTVMLQVVISGSNTSLIAPDVVIDDVIVGGDGNAGTILIYPATADKGQFKLVATDNTGDTVTTLTNAAMGQASVISIPDPGAATAVFILSKGAASPQTMSTGLTLTGASSDFQTLGGGDILAGASAAAGSVFSYPATAASGRLELRGVNSAGDYTVTVANASYGQSSVVSIPDAGAATANFILSATAAGTQSIGTGLSIVGANNVQTTGGGNFIAGASGTDGIFVSFPATATSGTLNLAAVTNATGDFDTTISNAAAVAQDQVISIPDVGAATGEFIIKTAALVNGNVVVASGTGGVVVDGGVAPAALQLSANLTSVRVAWAGGGTSNAFAVPGVVATSVVTATIVSEANASYILTAAPGSAIVTVTFNVDPGAVEVAFNVFVAPQ